jgi:hypothetical protein
MRFQEGMSALLSVDEYNGTKHVQASSAEAVGNFEHTRARCGEIFNDENTHARPDVALELARQAVRLSFLALDDHRQAGLKAESGGEWEAGVGHANDGVGLGGTGGGVPEGGSGDIQ